MPLDASTRRPRREPYSYIRQRYGLDYRPKQRVRHTVTGRAGVVCREPESGAHYVSVRFDGVSHTVPCHPQELTPE